MPAAPTSLRVRSGDLSIGVREYSASGAGRPTVVLVHGYPDQQDVWAELVERLPLDAWHVVTYDVRGAGCSDVPSDLSGYRTERLVDDLVAVLDAVLPAGTAAHLVGHDWGSVQLWDVVAAESTDPRLQGRIASFTSICGPSLDHAAWLARHPGGRRTALLRQQLRSSYVAYFCLPGVPDLVWRFGHRRLARLIESREGLPTGHWGSELGRNAANGLNLYRANIPRRLRRNGRLMTHVPVLVVHPTRDRYVTAVLTEDLDVACSDVEVVPVDAGHWVVVTHPDVVAALVVEHVSKH
jgi:pimeloyl-ACP methyl ester carboxylesterase